MARPRWRTHYGLQSFTACNLPLAPRRRPLKLTKLTAEVTCPNCQHQLRRYFSTRAAGPR